MFVGFVCVCAFRQAVGFTPVLRHLLPRTNWSYRISMVSEGTEGSLTAEYRAEIKTIDEKKIKETKTDKPEKAVPPRMGLTLTRLVERRSEAPEVRSERFGVASWQVNSSGIPEELSIGGTIGTYLVPFFCLYLPGVVDANGQFVDKIKLVDSVTIEGAGSAKRMAKEYEVVAQWKIDGASIATDSFFDLEGKLLRGTCKVSMSDAKATYSIIAR